MTKPAVLILDDDRQTCETLGGFLIKEGYRVQTAASGAQAMEILKREPIGLTLVNLRMPDMCGIRLLRELKKIDESMVVIMMTASGALDTAKRSMKWGAYDYLTKPINLEFLSHVIREGLEERAQMAMRGLPDAGGY